MQHKINIAHRVKYNVEKSDLCDKFFQYKFLGRPYRQSSLSQTIDELKHLILSNFKEMF